MTNKLLKRSLIALVTVIALTLCFVVLYESGVAVADTEEIAARFYLDTDTLYTEITVTDGTLTIPSSRPEKEGYTFQGWTDGGMKLYQPDETYDAKDTENDLSFYAVFKAEVQEITYKPVFSNTDKAFLLAGLAVFLALVAFIYWWFILNKKSFRDLWNALKGMIKRKR